MELMIGLEPTNELLYQLSYISMSTHNICATDEVYYTASCISCQYPF